LKKIFNQPRAGRIAKSGLFNYGLCYTILENMKIICELLILLLLVVPVFSQTLEGTSVVSFEPKAVNFWQEFDITFWQTLPFAVLWGYFIERQLSSSVSPGSSAHWEFILPFAGAVSAGNAYFYSRRATQAKKNIF
jgi:hypothetical protein